MSIVVGCSSCGIVGVCVSVSVGASGRGSVSGSARLTKSVSISIGSLVQLLRLSQVPFCLHQSLGYVFLFWLRMAWNGYSHQTADSTFSIDLHSGSGRAFINFCFVYL
jgi:hypothetical protein